MAQRLSDAQAKLLNQGSKLMNQASLLTNVNDELRRAEVDLAAAKEKLLGVDQQLIQADVKLASVSKDVKMNDRSVAGLEKQVKGRQLDQAGIRRVNESLSDLQRQRLMIIAYQGCNECAVFAKQLWKVFRGAGWSAAFTGGLGGEELYDRYETGLTVVYEADSTANATRLWETLQSLGFEVHHVAFPGKDGINKDEISLIVNVAKKI
jgi:hypothetical protein